MFCKSVIKSLLAVVFSTAILASASAELSVSGHVRAGAAVNTDAESIETSTWMGGNYFGGGSRSRIEISYDGNFGGATFRYTNTDFENFLDSGCIDWAMAYANFLDGKVIAEAGKITDRFTTGLLSRSASTSHRDRSNLHVLTSTTASPARESVSKWSSVASSAVGTTPAWSP